MNNLLRYFTILKLFLVVDEIQFRKQCPPKFIVPIQGSMVEEGQKVVLNGIFDGSPEPSVLWFHNQKPVRPSHDVKIEVGSKETSISFAKVRYKSYSLDYSDLETILKLEFINNIMCFTYFKIRLSHNTRVNILVV